MKNELKKVSDFSRNEKIALLTKISTKEIKTKQLSSESVIVSDGKEAFAGLMISVAHHKAGKQSPVIFVGKAEKLVKEAMNNIQAKRQIDLK